MKFYPYSRLKSVNLKLFLLFTRIVAVIGFIMFAMLLIHFYIYFFETGHSFLKAGETVYLKIKQCLVLFSLSGVCAAIVSCEYHLTKNIEGEK